ncbi:hypothetical protein SDC49_11515 [Lactobacillus sp. R2/2]|nr:hypothetical protein [Lactobacillus sp. R2/2]
MMGKEQSYQVCVQDLTNNKFARVSNTTQHHGVNSISRLFLLIAMTYQEQHGKSIANKAIKIKKLIALKERNSCKGNCLQCGLFKAINDARRPNSR